MPVSVRPGNLPNTQPSPLLDVIKGLPCPPAFDTPLAHYFQLLNGKVIRHVHFSNTGATLEAVRGRVASAAH